MFGKAEKGEIPALRGLYIWRHFPRQQQVFQRYGRTPGLPGTIISYTPTTSTSVPVYVVFRWNKRLIIIKSQFKNSFFFYI